MAKDNTNFDHTVASLFKGMDSFLTSRTVVGEPLTFGDTIIVPLVNVSFGVGAGAFSSDRANNGGGGMGGKMSPSAVLVIHNGTTRLINIATNSGMDKLLDLVPDFVDSIKSKKNGFKRSDSDKAVREEAAEVIREEVKAATEDMLEE
ncbi:MAG: GerW family sporulation protein [Lachnospiraceae bacterium]|nr:GerW family sporulation protein [Lachnospiraceae bacterium]